MKKIAGVVLAAALLAESPGTCMGAQQDTSDKIPITFMTTGTGNYAEERKKTLEEELLDDFPNIEIKVEAYPDEQYYSILNTKLSMGDGPDFFNVQPYWAGPNAILKLAPAGYLEPLDDLPVVAAAAETVTDPVSYEGHVYSVSFGTMRLCTYYNKEIFQKFGISVPQNWPEFLETCQTLKENGITPIVSGNKDSFALQFGLYQIAACQVYAENPEYNQQLGEGRVKFTDKGTWDAVIERYLQLYEKGYVKEHSLAIGAAEAVEIFCSGEAAMLFGGDFNSFTIRKSMAEEKIGVFALPANEKGHPVCGVVSNGGGMAVYAEGSHVELCKEICQKLYELETRTEENADSLWSEIDALREAGRYTINCNQGWKGDVEWVLEDGVSRMIGGEDISAEEVTVQMQKAYDKG